MDLNTILIALWIFTARTIDVSMGTVRQIMIIRGQRKLASFIGFFEIMVWASAISFVVTAINQIQNLVALGVGFATGTYLGEIIEERIALGYTLALIVPKKVWAGVESDFRAAGFGVTTVVSTGYEGAHPLYHIVFKRKDMKTFLRILKEHDPEAFYALMDVRSESGGFIRGSSKKK
jgi:uncharacterized protein YebE (UPF0316 family)